MIDTIARTFEDREASLEARLAELRKSRERLTQICQVELPNLRIQLLKYIEMLEKQGLEEDYSHTLLQLVQHAGEEGLALATVKKLLPENEKLSAARTNLMQAGRIVEPHGQTKRIQLAPTSAPTPATATATATAQQTAAV